jgi:hypothetical protein
MKNWITAIIIVAILLGAGYVLRYCTESPDIQTEIPPNDTLYVYGDTLWTLQDTVWAVKWEKIPAVTNIDTSGLVAKSISKDTLLVVDKDSIKVKANATYYPSEDTFDMGVNIDFRGYDALRIDTMKVNNYVPVEVKVTNPMWIIIAIVEFVVFVGAGILIMVGG